MPAQDTTQLKEKIVSFIRRNGPSLPVHIAREVGLSILFTSAFLSEILSEKTIKTSNMRVGSSALYLISGQEPQLEKFSNYLKSKEKEAYLRLKEKKILKDSQQEPAIRVALREIKDFAIPFRRSENDDLEWRFFTVSEDSIRGNIEEGKEELKIQEEPAKEKEEIQKKGPEKQEAKPETKEDLDIFDKGNEQEIKSKKKKRSRGSRKKTGQKENNFFMKVKETLRKKSIEMDDILVFNKNEIVLKIKNNSQEKILIAYNKKRIGERDIINASKKAEEHGNLPYIILGTGDPLKKTEELLQAVKNLSSIEKVE